MEITEYPREIKDRMVECQSEQGRDIINFSWSATKEGYTFWHDIICNDNYKVFFDRYPKKDKLDLTEILKDAPIGTKLYSTLHGEVEFKRIDKNSNYIEVTIDYTIIRAFTKNGLFFPQYTNAECVLFPSKENRDWSTFKVDYPINTPMMCSDDGDIWELRYYAANNKVFSRSNKQTNHIIAINFKYIIPVSEFDFINKCRLTK